MEETRYGLRVEIPVSYEQAIERATAALQAQGFGVLTTIDVKQTLKQKLDRHFRKYVILGACNPRLADRALHAELEVGLLLPCNVIVRAEADGRTTIGFMDPEAVLGMVDKPEVHALGKEVRERLLRVCKALG